jgi:hypothetical protein
VPGNYALVFHDTESELWQASGRPLDQVRLRIREGVTTARWMLGLTAVFAVLALWPLLRKLLHNRRRWAGSDWSDD